MQNALHAENMRLNPLTLSSAGSPHAFVRSRQPKADSWWVPFALGTFRAHCRQPLLNRITSELPVIRPQAAESLQIGPFHVRVVGLPWLAPSQTPQSARREEEGEAPEPAERPECPDEEEAAGGLGDLAVMCPPPMWMPGMHAANSPTSSMMR